MALTRCEAVVVRTYALGDTSRIAVLYSREFGLVRGVAKGARGPKRPFGAGLEPLSRVDVVLYRKDGRDLDLLSKVDVLEAWPDLGFARVVHAQAVLEFVDRLVWETEHEPTLYALVLAALAAIRTTPDEKALASITLAFRLQAAGVLGYRPVADRCAGCGAPPADRWAPAKGGAVCARCADGEGAVATVSREALTGLARALAADPPAFDPFASPRAGEMLRLVELHLKHHVPRFAGFKSLPMLLSLEGGGS